MRLTRNTTPDGKCKYAIVRLDKLRKMDEKSHEHYYVTSAIRELEKHGVLEYGEPGTEEECSRDALAPILDGLSDQERASLIGLLVGDYSVIELAMWRMLTIPARDLAHALASVLEEGR